MQVQTHKQDIRKNISPLLDALQLPRGSAATPISIPCKTSRRTKVHKPISPRIVCIAIKCGGTTELALAMAIAIARAGARVREKITARARVSQSQSQSSGLGAGLCVFCSSSSRARKRRGVPPGAQPPEDRGLFSLACDSYPTNRICPPASGIRTT